MIKLKGGDDKNSILNQTAKRMNMPTLNAKKGSGGGGGGSDSASIPSGPTPLAQRLGMPSASRSKQSQVDWSSQSQRINLGGPISIQSRSIANREEDEEEDEEYEEKRQLKSDNFSVTTFGSKDSDSEEDDVTGEEAQVLSQLRAARLAELKKTSSKTNEWKALGHGTYSLIVQDEFLKSVTSSKYAICHFTHPEFTRCAIVDKHLSKLAQAHLPTRFVSINAEKSPFFVQKLAIKTLPTIVMFKDGIAVDRIVGFDDLGGEDDFSTATLEKRLAKSGVLLAKENENTNKGKAIGSIRSSGINKSVYNDSDDDEDL